MNLTEGVLVIVCVMLALPVILGAVMAIGQRGVERAVQEDRARWRAEDARRH